MVRSNDRRAAVISDRYSEIHSGGTMGFHKHGIYSFSVRVERMSVIGGHNFVAEVTALRRHGLTGAARPMDVPRLPEQYGETATDAERRAIEAFGDWLNTHVSQLESEALQRPIAS